MIMDSYLEPLSKMPVFDKNTLFDVIRENAGELGKSTLEKLLNSYIEAGNIARVGRNAYCIQGNLKKYVYDYSEYANHIAERLNEGFYDIDFRIMELYQLNRFLNHQLAHNVFYVYVEKELCASAFELLKKEYEGRILINPSEEDFFNYRTEDTIVIRKLLTEAPKGKDKIWHTGIEKLLVDIFSENIVKAMFSDSELPGIYETAFADYVIDESQMFRYAKRRKSDERIKNFIKTETTVKLRLQ